MLPDILITQPQPKSCVEALKQHFTVHTLVGAADSEAVLPRSGRASAASPAARSPPP